MATFPGDPPVRVSRVRTIGSGSPYNLSQLQIGSHTGTHVDPPIHFLEGGAAIDQVDLDQLNGPVEVVRVPASAGSIGRDEARSVPEGVERVLFRTRNSDRWTASDRFFGDYVAVNPEGADEMVERGVRLVGLDALSVELDPTGTFPVHHRLLGAGCLILEGVLLGAVAPGRYELQCFPLRIAGGDGGPCRAVLQRDRATEGAEP